MSSEHQETQEDEAQVQEECEDAITNPNPSAIFHEDVWEHSATDEHHNAILLELLSSSFSTCAELNARHDRHGNRVVHFTAVWDRLDVLTNLIRRGVELNITNDSGQTALDMAMHWCHYDVANRLMYHGAKHSKEVERDLAICQRDVTTDRLRTSTQELEAQEQELLSLRLTVETERCNREALEANVSELVLRAKAREVEHARVVSRLHKSQRLVQQLEQAQVKLREELGVVQSNHQNALRGWELTQEYAEELKQLKIAALERETSAIERRDQALAERNGARELLRQAQVEQTRALICQRRAEAERNDMQRQHVVEMARLETKTLELTELQALVEEERHELHQKVHLERQIMAVEMKQSHDEQERLTREWHEMKRAFVESEAQVRQLKEALSQRSIDVEQLGRQKSALEKNMQRMLYARKQEKEAAKVRRLEEIHFETKDVMKATLSVCHELWTLLIESHSTLDPVLTLAPSWSKPTLVVPFSPIPILTPAMDCRRRPVTSIIIDPRSSPSSSAATTNRPATTQQLTLPPTSSASPNKRQPSRSHKHKKAKNHMTIFSQEWKLWCEIQMQELGEEEEKKDARVWTQSDMNVNIMNLNALAEALTIFLRELEHSVQHQAQHHRLYSDMQQRIIDNKQQLIDRMTLASRGDSTFEQILACPNDEKFRECLVRPTI